jgi:hypothetical protein
MESDYSDAPGSRGLLVTPPEQLYDAIIVSFGWGFQVAIHAIGDRANSLILDVFDKVALVIGPGAQRMRIEHAQHLKPGDATRFAKLGLIASMQPYHLADDGRWAEHAIGAERAKTTYAFRSLLDAGAVLAFGSDWFVTPPDVMQGIHAAVTRQTLDGKHPGGWVPEQKITVEEALKVSGIGGFLIPDSKSGAKLAQHQLGGGDVALQHRHQVGQAPLVLGHAAQRHDPPGRDRRRQHRG